MSDQQSTIPEKMARAAYEEYFSDLIGCCEPAWSELPEDHRDRCVRAQAAALAVVTRRIRAQAARLHKRGFGPRASIVDGVADALEGQANG